MSSITEPVERPEPAKRGALVYQYVRNVEVLGCRRGGSKCTAGRTFVGPRRSNAPCGSGRSLNRSVKANAADCAGVAVVHQRVVYADAWVMHRGAGVVAKDRASSDGISVKAMIAYIIEHGGDRALHAVAAFERGGSLRDLTIVYDAVVHGVKQADMGADSMPMAWSDGQGNHFGKISPGANTSRKARPVLDKRRPVGQLGQKVRDDSSGVGQNWLRSR